MQAITKRCSKLESKTTIAVVISPWQRRPFHSCYSQLLLRKVKGSALQRACNELHVVPVASNGDVLAPPPRQSRKIHSLPAESSIRGGHVERARCALPPLPKHPPSVSTQDMASSPGGAASAIAGGRPGAPRPPWPQQRPAPGASPAAAAAAAAALTVKTSAAPPPPMVAAAAAGTCPGQTPEPGLSPLAGLLNLYPVGAARPPR